MALSLGVTGRAAPGAFSPWLGPALAASEVPGPGPAPGAFSSRITHPSLQVFFLPFLCTAQFSLLPARIAKTPQQSWREMPGLEHDPTA